MCFVGIRGCESIELARQFASLFGVRPAIFSAPGRVNVIGEHTDYNEGFVMPSAIGLCTRVAISARQDRQLFIQSEQFPGHSVFDLDDLRKRSTGAWCDYVLGVAVVLQQTGHSLQGANLFVHGEIPMGAGLSSSSAIVICNTMVKHQHAHGEYNQRRRNARKV